MKSALLKGLQFKQVFVLSGVLHAKIKSFYLDRNSFLACIFVYHIPAKNQSHGVLQ
jgi:hypothetical protein